jgi:hypothetical protein
MGYAEGIRASHICFVSLAMQITLVFNSLLGYNHICIGLHRSKSVVCKKFPEKIFAVKGCTWIIGLSTGL